MIFCREKGFCSEADTDDSNTMNKKVRNAQIAQFNFIFGRLFLAQKIGIIYMGYDQFFGAFN